MDNKQSMGMLETFLEEYLLLEFGLLYFAHLFHEVLEFYLLVVEAGLKHQKAVFAGFYAAQQL